MADEEPAVDVQSSLPVKEEESEAPERSEEETTEIAVEEAEIHDASDNKRKLNDLEPLEDDEAAAKKHQICESIEETDDGSGHPTTLEPVTVADGTASDSALGGTAVEGSFEEHLDQDGEIGEEGLEKLENESLGNGQISSTNDIQHVSVDNEQNPSLTQQNDLPQAIHQTPYDLSSSSRKIEVPNNKVGIIIGKSGETIRFLQINSGARIQITRDADVGPLTSTRPVELTGTPENINKAEQLIKNVIAEADAGGSPSLVARGFSTSQPGSEQIEIQIPNGKVGVIIGKGGETIKNLQTKTGARIQLIPQHLPEGDSSSDRTVRITGNKKQVESAKEMINDVMNQPPTRPSSHSNTFRPPRGPSPVTQWGPPRPTAPTQQTAGYGHPQIGYTPPTTQYPQTYGGYSQQPPARGAYGSSWDQHRPAAAPPHSGGYDYYNQGGHVPNNQPSNTLPGSVPAPVNYNNYAQQQASDVYGHSQHKYGHGYNEPKYDNQPPGQHIYGQHQSVGSQPGMYGQQSSAPYGKPAYGEAPPSYGPARPSQPGEPMYQGAPPMQQPYPYASSAPTQPATYSQTYAPADGYSQQPSAGYPQQHAQVYGGQSVPQSSGYSQYPSSQPSYDQTAQTNANYGYQGGAAPDAGYAPNVSNSGYAVQQPVGNQLGYAQPAANPSGYYDQSVPPQSGYGVVPGAPVGYSKSVSPQPGYVGQYDSAQIYGQH